MPLPSQPLPRPSQLAALRRLPQLASCRDAELADLATLVSETAVPERTILDGEGSETFFILDGFAAVTVHGEPVGVLGPGQFVHELNGSQRSRNGRIIAKTPMRLLVIPRDALDAASRKGNDR